MSAAAPAAAEQASASPWARPLAAGDRLVTPQGVGNCVGWLLLDRTGARLVRRRPRGRPLKHTRAFPVVRLVGSGRWVAFLLEEISRV